MRELNGKFLLIVYPEAPGKPFALDVNEAFAFLFKEAQRLETFTVGDLAEELVKQYELPKDKALKDVELTVESWIQNGLAK